MPCVRVVARRPPRPPQAPGASPHCSGASSSSGASDRGSSGHAAAGYSGGESCGSPGSSNPGTPYGRPLLFSSFFFPMPFSPRALQQAAALGGGNGGGGNGGGGGGEPRTPTRGGGGGAFGGGQALEDNGVGGCYAFAPLAYCGSPLAAGGMVGGMGPPGPAPLSPGQLVFTQFFAPDAFDPAPSGEYPDSPPDGRWAGGRLLNANSVGARPGCCWRRHLVCSASLWTVGVRDETCRPEHAHSLGGGGWRSMMLRRRGAEVLLLRLGPCPPAA